MINGVKKVSATYGKYNLCIEADFETIEEFDAFVFDKLRVIPKIRETDSRGIYPHAIAYLNELATYVMNQACFH